MNITDIYDLSTTVIGVVNGEPESVSKMFALIGDKTFTAIQRIPYLQLKKYLDGVKKAECDIGGACKLADKLFSDSKTCNDNAFRMIKAVTSADTEKKIDYLVNATRSLLLGLIDVQTFFRIIRAVSDTLPEDLTYLMNNVERIDRLIGNQNVFALERSGLMISSGIDPASDVEKQEYVISSLGYDVDNFALSFDNEERQKWYKMRKNEENRKFGIPPVDRDGVNAIFEERKQDLIEATAEAVRPHFSTQSENEKQLNNVKLIASNHYALAILLYAFKTDSNVEMKSYINQQNRHLIINGKILPDNENTREIVEWNNGMQILLNTKMLTKFRFKEKEFQLTYDGYHTAEILIDQNSVTDDILASPYKIIEFFQSD